MSENRADDDRYIWKVLKRETIYTSNWINLHLDWVELPDGSVIEGHHVVEYRRKAVGVVAVNAAGQVMLVDHYRFINRVRSWEVPAGGIEVGERAEDAARRELLEEAGCTGGEYIYLASNFPSNGSTDQRFTFYLARGVEQTQPIQDTNEIIATRWFEVAEIRGMLDRDEVPDGLTQTALLLALFKGYLV